MKVLTVHRFSCISDATLKISPITLLVGPQASGKSVLCKLSYFFASLLQEQVRAIVESTPHKEFIQQMRLKFVRWFPYETWGTQKFDLSFHFGSCQIQIVRTVSRGKAGKGINISFDQVLIQHYERSLARVQDKAAKKNASFESPEFTYSTFSIERLIRTDLSRVIESDFVNSQIFIPAARSFFTSVGRAIAAFENSNMLDPLTVLFGKMYSSRSSYFPVETSDERAIHVLLDQSIEALLGGKMVRERDREVLQTKDGRTIPLSSLSSGQQEIFPLLRVLPQTAPKNVHRLLYVEEPEAHLFPDAQSKLVELLAALANLYGPTVEMVITTHSPYVLTKFNNLIMAGKVGKRRSKASLVGGIVAARSWIAENMVAAYALDGGRLIDLIDSDGLIDGGYLDEVSNHIASEFTKLVDVEFTPTRAVYPHEVKAI